MAGPLERLIPTSCAVLLLDEAWQLCGKDVDDVEALVRCRVLEGSMLQRLPWPCAYHSLTRELS